MRRSSRHSLRRRLLTQIVGATLLVVGGACLFIWFTMFYSLRHALDLALHTEALAIASRLELEGDRIEFEVPPDETLLNVSTGGALVQIIGDDKSIIFFSPELARESRSKSVDPKNKAIWETVHLGRSKDAYRSFFFQAVVKSEDQTTTDQSNLDRHAWVFIARPLKDLNETLYRLAAILLFTAALASAVAFQIGHVVSRSATEPITSLSIELSQVMPGRMELALDRKTIPTEFDPIVQTVEDLLTRIRSEIERQRQLTSDIAHDLRTPLAGVRTLLDVCVLRTRKSDEYVETIHKAQSALRQLSGLVDNVLHLARLDAKSDRPIVATFAIKDVVDAAIATVQPLADTRGIAIEWQSSEMIDIHSDRSKLVTILSNLLTNALEHSPLGESVLVATRSDELRFEIIVEDHGIGVPAYLHEHIFERFVRGDESRSTNGHHGLGLAIARGLARMLGGDLLIDGSYPTGCRFVLVLPRDLGSNEKREGALGVLKGVDNHKDKPEFINRSSLA